MSKTVQQWGTDQGLTQEAEIRRLREENARLRESLQTFVTFHSGHVLPMELRFAMAEARKVLEEEAEP